MYAHLASAASLSCGLFKSMLQSSRVRGCAQMTTIRFVYEEQNGIPTFRGKSKPDTQDQSNNNTVEQE